MFQTRQNKIYKPTIMKSGQKALMMLLVSISLSYGHVITQISRKGRWPRFLRYGATVARVELRYYAV